MKVLMYGWEFPPNISGGLGVACYFIVNELAKKHIDLTLILPYPTVPGIDHVNMFGCDGVGCASNFIFDGIVDVKYSSITLGLSPYNSKEFKSSNNKDFERFTQSLASIHLPEYLKNMIISAGEQMYSVGLLAEVIKYAAHAGELARDVICDIIYAHDWLTMLAALEAKHYLKKPVVLHVHSLETDRSGYWVDKRIFAIEKIGMEQADHIIAVSQYTKDNIVKYYGIDPNKITVVHNGVYFDDNFKEDTASNNRPKMVLFLGRITHQKGPSFFIETAKLVLAKRDDVQFVLVGTGDLLTGTIEQVANLRIGKNVHFMGFLSRDKVREIYQLADVYVMPSVSEPFGLSALEAISYNVSSIISKQSGVAEVLHHTMSSDFWDADDMAAKILALLEYSSLRKTQLALERKNLKEFTWDKSAEKIIKVYDKTIKG